MELEQKHVFLLLTATKGLKNKLTQQTTVLYIFMQNSNKTYKCIRKSCVKNKSSVSIGTVTDVILLQLGKHWNSMIDALGPYTYIKWISNENDKYSRKISAQ